MSGRKHLRLGIDLDGVVAQFNKGWMDRHGREFGSDLDPSMVTEWNGLHRLGGFATKGAFWDWFRNGDEPSTFRHLEPYPEAIETLHRLAGQRHRIVVITSKFEWAIADTFGWLSEVELPSPEVHIRSDKHVVDCDVYLDDSPLVLPELVRHRADALICRFVRSWNDPVPGTVDVSDWAQFEALVAVHASR